MTMWTSVDAINAEVQYRRERLESESRALPVSKRWAMRRRRAAEVRRRRAQEAEQATGGPARHHSGAAELPAQRTSGSSPVTEQRLGDGGEPFRPHRQQSRTNRPV